MTNDTPPKPVHVPGTRKGNEVVRKAGPEPGRHPGSQRDYRTARDSTSISPDGSRPIHPDMPEMPPA